MINVDRIDAMLTLQETLTGQDNLDQLCADRPLKTSEVFAGNAFYGIDAILKRYAGLPQTYPLKVVVPHGPFLSEDFLWEAEEAAPLPVVFCYPPYRERVYVNRTGKRVILSASPFLYVVEMLKNQPQPGRRGTIFFPSHSSHYMTVQMDFERLAEELAHLGDEYKPITVCIYWRDFNLGHHIAFQKRGMRIVSAGHMYDPDFLFRFYHLCSMHRYAACSGPGSHIFYSVKSGCSYFHFDKVKYSYIADDHVRKRDAARASPTRRLALESLFCKPQPFATTEQLKAADYYLGADYFKSARELRQQLLYAEALDKASFVVRNKGGAVHFAVPTCYRRSGRVWKRRLAGVRRRLSRLWTRTVAGLLSR